MAKAGMMVVPPDATELTVPTKAHPLDPISTAEIDEAVRLYKESKEGQSAKAYFSYAKLVEPPKAAVLGWKRNGSLVPRVIRVVGSDALADGGFQCDVDVQRKSIVEFQRLPSTAQAPLNLKDISQATKLVKSDPAFIQAIEKRGLNPELVETEPWPPGTGIVDSRLRAEGARIWRCTFFYKLDDTDNCYGRPIHGLLCDVDINNRKTDLIDHGPYTMPPDFINEVGARFDTASSGVQRDDLKRIEIRQPDGVSFEVNGHCVKWAGWEFRIRMDPVSALVIHDVSFHGRPILYRASLSDMVVPYADADPQHSFKHVLDGSEPLICGANTNSLKLGCDCLGEIFYFDMDYLSFGGKGQTKQAAVCMHEEDASIQWKHTDMRTGVSEVRRARRLVVSTISTVGNYDYGWYYHFHLDGEIEVEVKLTGILSVGGSETADPQYTKVVAPGIAAPLHQHLFCFRFDWNLDDGPNSLCEEQVELLPKNENPTGNVFRHVSRLLQTEGDAMRKISPELNRTWKILNRNKMNGLGKPVAYKVLSGAAPTLLAHDNATVAKRGAFAKYNLWATPYTDGELFAAGEHTAMGEGGQGLPSYTKGNRNIVDCDLVTWHTIGATHIPRPEDWPVMPVEKARLNLVPVGFFDKSPVMNLPPGSGGNICQSKL